MPDKNIQETPNIAWDETIATKIVGRKILLGITYINNDGSVDRQEQMHGVVKQANIHDGIEIQLRGVRDGEVYWLPPDTRGIEPATPGEYALRATGEKVINPDFTAMWTVTAPPIEN